MSDRFLVQAAAAHLTVAMRLLDQADFKIPAAHVDAALSSLVSELRQKNLSDALPENLINSGLDRMIEEIYVTKSRDTGDPTIE